MAGLPAFTHTHDIPQTTRLLSGTLVPGATFPICSSWPPSSHIKKDHKGQAGRWRWKGIKRDRWTVDIQLEEKVTVRCAMRPPLPSAHPPHLLQSLPRESVALRVLERHPESSRLWNPCGAAHCRWPHTDNRLGFPKSLCQGVRVLSVVARAAVVLRGKGSRRTAEPAAAPRRLKQSVHLDGPELQQPCRSRSDLHLRGSGPKPMFSSWERSFASTIFLFCPTVSGQLFRLLLAVCP